MLIGSQIPFPRAPAPWSAVDVLVYVVPQFGLQAGVAGQGRRIHADVAKRWTAGRQSESAVDIAKGNPRLSPDVRASDG